MDMFSSIPVRPIETVVAGLDRDQAKVALAREAFPDNEGHAFMVSLQSKFPKDHDVLLGALADRALKGGDRDALVMELNEWSAEFAPKNFAAISRTGNDGFDAGMEIIQDGLGLLEKTAGGCTANTLMTTFSDPTTLASLTAYGSEAYKVNVRATHTLVDLADKGRNRSPVDTDLTPDDMTALQTTFFSFMMDPQVMGLMASMNQGGRPIGSGAHAVDPNEINLCQLGRTVIVKLKKLPHPTKARLIGLARQRARPLAVHQCRRHGRKPVRRHVERPNVRRAARPAPGSDAAPERGALSRAAIRAARQAVKQRRHNPVARTDCSRRRIPELESGRDPQA